MKHIVPAALFFLLLLARLALPAGAQEAQPPAVQAPAVSNLIGYVVDATTRRPLAGALVELPAFGRRAITDAEGRFLLLNLEPGEYLIRVTLLGYEPFETVSDLARGRAVLTLALGPRPIVLPGVTAQAYGFSRQIENRRLGTGVSSRVLPREQIVLSAASDARQLILNSGGLHRVACSSRSYDVDCLLVRGRAVTPSVYIDERRAMTGLEELEMYAPEDIYMVEVYGAGRHIRIYTVHFVETRAARGQVLGSLPFR
jgi:hypothetical protein